MKYTILVSPLILLLDNFLAVKDNDHDKKIFVDARHH